MADTRANQEIEDLSAIDADEHTSDEWERLIRAMRSGDTSIVSESVGSYFLGVLPPRWFPGNGSFAFCEGDDRYTLFVAVDGRWLMRTVEYGERSASVLRDRVHEMRGLHQHRRSQGEGAAGSETLAAPSFPTGPRPYDYQRNACGAKWRQNPRPAHFLPL